MSWTVNCQPYLGDIIWSAAAQIRLAVDNSDPTLLGEPRLIVCCGMDRDTLLHDLVDIERDIALGEAELADRRARIVELDRDGKDMWAALDALAELKAAQEAHERRRELIIRALSPPR